MKTFEIRTGEGKHAVYLFATVTERGILASLVGGEDPHLGGVVVSVPRPSLANPEKTSCTTTVVPLLGHKDDEAAKPVAEMLAKETGQPVSLAAGLHVRSAGPEDITAIGKNCMLSGKKLLKILRDAGK